MNAFAVPVCIYIEVKIMLKAILVNERKNMNIMIQEMINWNALGITVTATAETGDEALEKIIEEVPDIVILNAKIRGISGPELVRIARDNGVFPEYIIIAGPRSFEAVYSAMQCGITEYLVGALDLKKLTDTLKKVSGKRMQNELAEQNEARERRLFEMNKDIIRRHFISNVLNGSIDTVNTINRVNGEFLFNFRPGTYEVMIICPDFAEDASITKNELDNILDGIGMVVSDQIGKRCIEHVWFRRRSVIVCVLNYEGDMHGDYEQLFDRLSRITKEKGGSLTIALGVRVDELRNIRKSLQTAEESMGYRLTLGTDKIIPYGIVKFSDTKLEDIFTAGIERRIRNSIVAFNSEELRNVVLDLFNTMDSIGDINPLLYWDVSNRIADMLLASLRDKNIFIGSIETMSNDFKRILLLAPTPAHICATVNSWVTGIIERVVYDENTKESRAIRIAKAYIKEHYMEQIKLDEIAKVTSLNSSYFSTLFKKETGENFSDFLIGCRLTEAKKLLKETTLTINEITSAIGYSDSKYFSKLFVKNVGITPSEYRKIYA